MLVITRKIGEKIVINKNITITIGRIVGDKSQKRVELDIDAPREVRIGRSEKFQGKK